MPRRKGEDGVPHLPDADVKQFVANFTARQEQVFNLEYLLTSAVDYARKIKKRNDSPKLCKELGLPVDLPNSGSVVNERSSDWKRLRSLAGSVLTWAQQLQDALDNSDTKAVAVFAIKLGAAAREMELIDNEIFRDWPTPGAAKDMLRVEPSEVSKLIAAGVLKTNGARGKNRIRINPMSILQRLKQQGTLSDPDQETIAKRTAIESDAWGQQERAGRMTNYGSFAEMFVSPDDDP